MANSKIERYLRGKRDFRVIAFYCSAFDTPASLLEACGFKECEELTPQQFGKYRRKIFPAHGKFETDRKVVLVSDEEIERYFSAGKKGGAERFRYDVYAYQARSSVEGKNIFLVATQFSVLAREIFVSISERISAEKALYLQFPLDALYERMVSDSLTSEETLSSLTWTVSGETGKIDSVVLKGGDLGRSEFHRQFTAMRADVLQLGYRSFLKFIEMNINREDITVGFKIGVGRSCEMSIRPRGGAEVMGAFLLLLDKLLEISLPRETEILTLKHEIQKGDE